MSSSISSLVNNLTGGLHNDKCKDCKSCLKYKSTKDNQIVFNWLKCNKNNNKDFNKDLTKNFANTYKFCGGDINAFILLLRKGIYPCET